MKPNQGREAAYVTSRVKDLSLITNTPDFVGCFACITPKAHGSLENDENVAYIDSQGNIDQSRSEENKVYLPQLVRDVDTLDLLFGDPRVDPETYRDLYSVRYIIQNGFACYVAKVRSGNPFSCMVTSKGLFANPDSKCPVNPQLDNEKLAALKTYLMGDPEASDSEGATFFNVKSSIVGTNTLTVRLVPFKPYSLSQVSLEVIFNTQATPTSDVTQVASARVTLTPDTKNADLVKTLNSYLGGDLVFSLPDYMDDSSFATVDDADEFIEPESENQHYICIVNALLYICGIYEFKHSDDPNNPEYLDTLAMDDFPALLGENLTLFTKYGLYGLDAVNKENNPSSSDSNWPRSYSSKSNPATFECSISVIENAVLQVSSADYTRSFRTYNDVRYSGTFISELASMVTYTEEKPHTIYVDNYEVVPNSSLVDGETYYKNENQFEDADPSYVEFTYSASEGLPTENVEYEHHVYSDNALTTEVAPENLVDDTTYYYDSNEGTGGAQTVASFTYTSSTPNIPTYTVEEAYIPYALNGKRVERDPKFSNPNHPTYYINNNEGTSASTPQYEAVAAGATEAPKYNVNVLGEISSDERRGLHYIIKDVAAQRKNLTCIFTTPYAPYNDKDHPVFDLDTACDWVAARGDFSDLFEYGTSNTTVYAEQAFYCEMYWSWCKWRVVKLVNGLATGSSVVVVPASAFVIMNSMSSFRARGTFYPVAGDQGGVLSDSLTILQNPSTKAQRDKLISYRINPIFDTGVRGIQIYGNDTLNPQYTDLSAAHIARTLVNIRSRVDEYSETIKFSLNNQLTWGGWITYVSTKILDPIKALGGLQWYQVDMGYNTTTRDEISQRKIRGMISLQFTQSLEIIDLEFTVYASSLNMEEEA